MYSIETRRKTAIDTDDDYCHRDFEESMDPVLEIGLGVVDTESYGWASVVAVDGYSAGVCCDADAAVDTDYRCCVAPALVVHYCGDPVPVVHYYCSDSVGPSAAAAAPSCDPVHGADPCFAVVDVVAAAESPAPCDDYSCAYYCFGCSWPVVKSLHPPQMGDGEGLPCAYAMMPWLLAAAIAIRRYSTLGCSCLLSIKADLSHHSIVKQRRKEQLTAMS